VGVGPVPQQLKPPRFTATPRQVDRFLREHFAEDVLLRYQQAVGASAVEEAAKDLRMEAATLQLATPLLADALRQAAASIDPVARGSSGPYPSALVFRRQPC
jgi:hypothetical protein